MQSSQKSFFRKFCINQDKKIIDALKMIEKSGVNLLLATNEQSKFLGVISSSDLRRAFINGYQKMSSLKKIINYKPFFFKR